MRKPNPVELQQLKLLKLLDAYASYKGSFDSLARSVYLGLKRALPNNAAPMTADDVLDPLAVEILANQLFISVVGLSGHTNPAFYPAYAKDFSRYILDQDWTYISH